MFGEANGVETSSIVTDPTTAKELLFFFNPKSDIVVKKSLNDKNGRYMIFHVTIDEVHFTLCNVYLPNEAKNQCIFLEELMKKMNEFPEEHILIGGDFNCPLTNKDKKGGSDNQTKQAVVESINKLMTKFNLKDIWRIKHPDLQRFSWRDKAVKFQSRLDYFLLSKHLIKDTENCQILYFPHSDHSAVSISLKTKELKQERGPGFWKFNSSLLKHKIFTEAIRKHIQFITQKYNSLTNNCLKWDMIKMEIGIFTRSYCKKKSRQKRDEETELLATLTKLEQEIDKTENETIRTRLIKQSESIKGNLDQILNEKVKGTILRSKVRWYEDGERNSKYFYNLEKRNFNKKHITKLVVGNKVIEEPSEILKEEEKFYQNLYKSETKINEQQEVFLTRPIN